MKQLADRVNATVHFPEDDRPKFYDRLLSRLIGSPGLWAYARRLARQLSRDDIVFCLDEQIGLPLVAACRWRRNEAKILVLVHNIDRPRGRAALRLVRAFKSADQFLAVSKHQIEFLRDTAGIEAKRTVFIHDQTDLTFFKPGEMASTKKRPSLVSAGLERRDYKVLAEAAAHLDVDVYATGFSSDAAPSRSRLPDEWPSNFHARRYEWPELAQLYRDADAVVVTLVPNLYAAGITTIVEGMASGRPVIVTSTEGLKGYLDDDDALIVVSPGNAEELRRALVDLLASSSRIEAMGRRAAEIAQERYSSERYVDTIAELMEAFA
jgi:glycosyltransferase involved in cell wall biosynthesis